MRRITSLADAQLIFNQILDRLNLWDTKARDQHGLQIKNLGDATDPADAVTLRQLQGVSTTQVSNITNTTVSSGSGGGGVGPPGPPGPQGIPGPQGPPGISAISSGILTGGFVVWVSGYSYIVSAATYVINNVTYTSPQTSLTLTTADPSFDRIDAIIVDNTGVVSVIAGTPAANPLYPNVDPATQLPLSFVIVSAGSSAPGGVRTLDIYHENTEWTSAVTANFNAASTNNPRNGSVDIEATTVVTGNSVSLTNGAAIAITSYDSLVFYIRSKAQWKAQRNVQIYFANAGVRTGNIVILNEGAFSFNSSNTTSYQQIVIPITQFAPTVTAAQLWFVVSGSSTSIGFYLDDITLQGGVSQPPPPTPGGDPAQVSVNNVKVSDDINGTTVNDTYSVNVTRSGGAVQATRLINTAAPLTGGGALSADLSLAINTMTGDSGSGGARGVVPAPGAGDAAAGKFLKADGTFAVPAGGGSSNRVLLESHSASSSASLIFTTRNASGQSGATFQSDYKVYEIMFVNLVPASNADSLRAQVTTDGGSTYNSTSNYDGIINYYYSGGTGSNNNLGLTYYDFGNSIGNSANWGICATYQMYNPTHTTLYKRIVGTASEFDTSAAAILGVTRSLCWKVTTAINGMKFYFNGGNIASGDIYIFGVV